MFVHVVNLVHVVVVFLFSFVVWWLADGRWQVAALSSQLAAIEISRNVCCLRSSGLWVGFWVVQRERDSSVQRLFFFFLLSSNSHVNTKIKEKLNKYLIFLLSSNSHVNIMMNDASSTSSSMPLDVVDFKRCRTCAHKKMSGTINLVQHLLGKEHILAGSRDLRHYCTVGTAFFHQLRLADVFVHFSFLRCC
jgi:hypothetical protein